MALAAYEQGESLKELVADCERLTSNPHLDWDPATKLPPIDGALSNAPAYRWLLNIIRDLYLQTDWHFAIQARTLAMATARCLWLPSDFWRVAYESPLYGLLAGQKFKIRHITREQFFDDPNSTDQGPKGRPTRFYVSRPDQLIYLMPQPDQAYAYELHYFKLVDELTSIEEIPQFPYRSLLRQLLLIKYYEDQDDTRLSVAQQELTVLWSQIRTSNYDMREDSNTGPGTFMDPQFFRRPCYED